MSIQRRIILGMLASLVVIALAWGKPSASDVPVNSPDIMAPRSAP